jgi:sporulation protein YabP
METKKETTNQDQSIILRNKKNLSVSGTTKIISLKSDTIQLETIFGGLIITGDHLELLKLDNSSTTAEILGNINGVKFIETKRKEPLFRKIFK